MMALQGDGNGIVTFGQVVLSGDFTISGTVVLGNTPNVDILLGDDTKSGSFLAFFSNGSIQMRGDDQAGVSISGFSPGQEVDIVASRTGDVFTLDVNGSTQSQGSRTGDVIFNAFFTYNNGFRNCVSLMKGVWTITGATTGGDRSYDMEQAEGATTLPDSTSSQNGTLSGFTTGGFTAPAGSGITIDSPTAFTGKQADGSGNATFTISGTCADTVTAVEVSTDNTTWSTLDASPTTSYSGNVVINGQRTVYVRAANDVADSASVEGITSGVTIAAWGQSNCAGRGINNQSYTVGGGPTPIMYRNGSFSAMSDPTGIDGLAAGSLWPLIAQRYIDEGTPLIVANVAEGGTTIQAWQTGGSLYPRITSFANAVGGVDLAISVIGEADSGGTTKSDFKTRYLAVASELNTLYGCDQYAVKFPVGAATNTDTQAQIREAYDELIAENEFIKFGGDLSVIDIDTGTGQDGLHLKTDQHLSEGAAIIEAALFGELSGITIDIGAPDGTYRVYLIDQSDNVVYNGNATFSGGSATLSGLTVAVGVELEGYTIDNESPHVNGAVITGVTV